MKPKKESPVWRNSLSFSREGRILTRGFIGLEIKSNNGP